MNLIAQRLLSLSGIAHPACVQSLALREIIRTPCACYFAQGVRWGANRLCVNTWGGFRVSP